MASRSSAESVLPTHEALSTSESHPDHHIHTLHSSPPCYLDQRICDIHSHREPLPQLWGGSTTRRSPELGDGLIGLSRRWSSEYGTVAALCLRGDALANRRGRSSAEPRACGQA
jgi:hypothetical protein